MLRLKLNLRMIELSIYRLIQSKLYHHNFCENHRARWEKAKKVNQNFKPK